MQDTLINKLHEYIRENNPDLLMELEEEGRVTEYLSDKLNTVTALLDQVNEKQPAYIVEEKCLDILTQDLRPSKFNYISLALEEEFETTYHELRESGTLKFEVINLITLCQPVFEDLKFSESDEDNQFLKYAVTGTIREYLENKRSE